MALDKNDGIFLPSIEGVVSGKTSQVDGMNGIMNNLIGNDNYLKDKKLDKGNYDGTAEILKSEIDFNLLATLGIEYGGILNNTNAKVSGKAYYDTTGKKLYKCIANTSINYADAVYFEALSNNDLLSKIQNLEYVKGQDMTVSQILNGVNISSSKKIETHIGTFIYVAGSFSGQSIPDNTHIFKIDIKTNCIIPVFLSIDLTTSYIGQGNAWLKGDGRVQLVSPFNISDVGQYGFYTLVFLPKVFIA